MTRRNQILIAALALQLVLVTVVFWPQRSPAAATGQALLPGLTAEMVRTITITDAQGTEIELARNDSGWVLPAADDYPALAENVTTLLNKIASLTADRLITQTATSHKRLKVAEHDYNTRIVLALSDGTQRWLYLGSASGYAATHVRVGDQDQVYLVSNLTASDASTRPTAWVDSSYFAVAQNDVISLTIENANGRLEFAKDASGVWAMAGLAAGEVFDQSAFSSFLSGVTRVSLLRPLGKEERAEYGLQAPAAVVVLKTNNATDVGQTYTLRVGAQDPTDQSYVFAASSSPYYVRVSSYTVSGWIEKSRADFLSAPATATP